MLILASSLYFKKNEYIAIISIFLLNYETDNDLFERNIFPLINQQTKFFSDNIFDEYIINSINIILEKINKYPYNEDYKDFMYDKISPSSPVKTLYNSQRPLSGRRKKLPEPILLNSNINPMPLKAI